MKKILLLIALIVAGYFGYQYYIQKGGKQESAAFKTYQAFANHLAKREFNKAREMASQSATGKINLKEYQYNLTQQLWPEVINCTYGLESETSSTSGNEVNLVTMQEQLVDPNPLAPSLANRRIVRHRHTATLQKTDAGWRVTAFHDKVIKKKSP